MSKIKDAINEKREARREEKAKKQNITQQNIEESREEILAKGKKFKYPFQYAKHRLIINAIAIGLVAIIVFVVVGWVQLYKTLNTSEVMYRFTRTIPLSVANVDGVNVRFSDYLLLYRSSIRSLERQQGELGNTGEAEKERRQFMRQALTDAEDYSYAMAKLKEADKEVTNEEIDEVIKEHKTIDGEQRSDEAFEGIVKDNFGLSIKEYRRLITLSLARKKVSMELDKDAKELADQIEEVLATNGGDMKKAAAEFAENKAIALEEVDAVEFENLDGGRAAEAAKLEKVGDISQRFASKSGDGYYFVKLTDKTETTVSYQSIWIRFDWFNNTMQKMRDDGKVKEKITIEIPEGDNSVPEVDQPEKVD